MRAPALLWLAVAIGGPLVSLPPAAAAGTRGGPAADPLLSSARLQGSFSMAGRITRAVGVPGERRGQRLTRSWAFASSCPSGACPDVTLHRARAGGTDLVQLARTGPARYAGAGSFYVPVRCGARVIKRGELARFSVTVQVTGATSTPSGVLATAIHATFTGHPRRNFTRCVAVAGRDAAVYQGSLVAGT